MTKYSTGSISKLVNRTREAVRQAEGKGKIPTAQRNHRGFRYWTDDDLPAIRRAFHIQPPPVFAESLANILNDAALPDSLDGFLEALAPLIAQAVEALQGDEALQQAAMTLLGKQATPTLVGR